MNDYRRSPSGEIIQPQSSKYFGAFPNIYLATDGDDTLNTGLTAESPLRTIEAALNMAAVSSVVSKFWFGPGDFEAEGLGDSRLVLEAEFEGAPCEEVYGEVTVTSYDAASRTITVSGASGWTTNQFAGFLLEALSGGNEGSQPTIIQSGATTLSTGAFFAVPQVGDTFRIVRPTTRILFGADELILGPLAGSCASPYPRKPVCRYWRKIEFRKELNVSTQTNFTGNHSFDGVMLATPDTAVWLVFLNDGLFNSGTGFATIDEGCGLSTINEGGGTYPRITFNRASAFIHLVSFGLALWEGSELFWVSGFIRTTVGLRQASRLTTVNSATICIYINGASSGSIVLTSSTLSCRTPIVHQGSSAFVGCTSGNAFISRNPIIAGSGGALNSARGGQIELTVDMSTISVPCLVGFNAASGQVSRAAAPFAVGDSVCTFANFPKDLGNIYRSS